MTLYATPAELIARKRIDTINDLANDGERQSASELLTNENLLAALADASGAMEAALLAAGRYSPADLASLEGNSQSLRVRICCEIAMAFLFQRNPTAEAAEAQLARTLAEAHLARLASGENVFNLPHITSAGLPTVNGPTTFDYQQMNLLPDRTRGFYPARHSRQPKDRQ